MKMKLIVFNETYELNDSGRCLLLRRNLYLFTWKRNKIFGTIDREKTINL